MIQIAIMGYGVVGSGVAEVIATHKDSLKKRANKDMEIKYILDIREFPDSPFADKFTKSFDDILNDDDVKIVIEVMGGLKPAYEYVKACLENGKSVVTSNKELVAIHGAELLSIAKNKNVNFLFEASVGGGIPIIRPISQCLAANEVSQVAGILNGTTNFILTKMIDEHMPFDKALAIAQELGYAERDPSADVDGIDSLRKICILASLTFGKHVYPDNIHTEGIRDITLEDVEYAAAWGGAIKLIGNVTHLENGLLDIYVAPLFISNSSQLSGVNDVFNGILVRGDATGDVVFYGKGAGKLPTASAVVADVIDCIKHVSARKYLYWEDTKENLVLPYDQSVSPVYIRVATKDRKTALQRAEDVFGHTKFLSRNNSPEDEIAFVTMPMPMGKINEKISLFESEEIKILSKIRIGDL